MRGVERHRVIASSALAVLSAESARCLLTPRRKPIKPIPVQIRSYFSEAEIDRGQRFSRPQRTLGLARMAVDLGALSAIALLPPKALRRSRRRPVLAAATAAAALTAAMALPSLPLRAISRRRAIAAGLDTQPWSAWWADLAKASAIEAAFSGAAGAAAIAAVRRYPRRWWLPAAGASVLTGAVLAALAPVVLDPLFNDFTPLPEGEARTDVLELAGAAGVKVGAVYSVDASRRTTAANAYVTGLGPTKRVVLFDTLLDRYSRDELRIVVAHELAHVRHRDVPRTVLFAALVAPAVTLAAQRLSWTLSPARDTPAALPALALAAALVGAPVGLVGNRLSRAVERRADEFSLELGRAPEAFVSFERTIALQNLADLEPPAWTVRLLATHPPTAERIGAALAWAERQAPAATGG